MAEDKPKPRCNPDQYNMLKECSDKKDMSQWNQWRKNNPGIEIWLEGANLPEKAYLEGAELWGAKLKKAEFLGANLKEAKLRGAELKNAVFLRANLEGTILSKAILEGTKFWEANLEGAEIEEVYLKSVQFHLARVNSKTRITRCDFDEKTDFSGVGLDAASIDPELKAGLKNNIRRIQWQKWIKEKQGKEPWRDHLPNTKPKIKSTEYLEAWLVQLFWWISDYGSSTKRIIYTFFWMAFGFGVFYWLLTLIPGWNGIIKDLWQGNCWIGGIQTFIRALYFSIVTMTTLGFGDMHAASNGFLASVLGSIFLSLQVILGYVLLGALVTRLGILFTNEAPAAKPAPIEKTKNDD